MNNIDKNIYNYKSDLFCIFYDILPFIFLIFSILISCLNFFALGVWAFVLISIALIICYFLCFADRRFFKERIYYFALNEDNLIIEYSNNGKNKYVIKIPYSEINSFNVNYNVLYNSQGFLDSITANIIISTQNQNIITIKSTGAIYGLIRFLCHNEKNIPNFEQHTNDKQLQKIIEKYEKEVL